MDSAHRGPEATVEPARRRTAEHDTSAATVRRLVVGPVDDPLEADADRIGGLIQSALSSSGPHACGPGCGHGDARIHRRADGIGRHAAAGADGGELDTTTSDRIRRASGGVPLDPDLRRRVEPVVGRDLSGVRIHRESSLAPELGAEAFTLGDRIHMAPGRFDPTSASGRSLLAHELGHVVQNTEPRVRRSAAVRRRVDPRLPRDVFGWIMMNSQGTRSLENHRPSTGLGQFDAEYLPNNGPDGRLVITVKPFFEWVQTVAGDVVTPGGWTDPEKADFIAKFREQTVRAWSGKYRFECTKPGFTDLAAAVEVRCVPVDDITKSHFHHRIQKDKSMSTGIGREQNSGAARNTGNFAQQDAPVRPHDSATTCAGIASHDQGRLDRLITTFALNPIRFVDDDTASLDTASKGRIDAFVAAAKRTERPGSVPIPLVAVGKRNKREKLGKDDKAQKRATTLANYIRAKDFKNNTVETEVFDDQVEAQNQVYKSKKSALSKQAEKDKLDPMKAVQYRREAVLEVKKDFVWQGDPYSILAHEFGHMLGSPDEYFGYGSVAARDAKANQLIATGRPEDAAEAVRIQGITPSGNDSHATAQEAMSKLATDAGVEIPEYGPKTSSIMSAGADVLPAHYLPLMEALGEITGGVLTKNDWTIA